MKQTDDRKLRAEVNKAWPPSADSEPAFDDTWQAARARHSAARRRYRRIAGVAAIVAAAVIALYSESPTQETYIHVADLLETTYWTAPSDVLLPERKFDIYQDMPVLFESTEPAGGTLL
jgi:hypothetical protein